MDTPVPYLLAGSLSEEVRSASDLHPQITTLNQLFLKYLKEPRYQSPLTIDELSDLFQYFYRDLKSLIVNIFTQSNSTKKSLIASSNYFNSNPKKFDYLLAIANYSSSSIKLLKRSDPDALLQLRIFNYYKFLIIFESLESAQLNLFNSINNDDIKLYDKIFRFDQKDIIYQEFLTEKLANLKALKLPFSHFIESQNSGDDTENNEKLIKFINSITKVDLIVIQKLFNDLNCKNLTPYSKLSSIVSIHKLLIKIFVKSGQFKNSQINNDILLPTLIYFIIYKLNTKDLFLNFMFIKNFLNLIDPYKIEIYPLNLYSSSSYNPLTDKTQNKYFKQGNLFEFLNINTTGVDNNNEDSSHDSSSDEFFADDKELINYLSETYLNSGELNYYLTNFEAIIVFLSNITVNELMSHNASLDQSIPSNLESTTNKLLTTPISKLVDEELLTHFQFPDGKLKEEIQQQKSNEGQTATSTNTHSVTASALSQLSSSESEHNQTQTQTQTQSRSRSSSILNTISNKISETRTRSNSSIMNTLKPSNQLLKENFPSLMDTSTTESSSQTDSLDLNSGFNMMKNILGRFSSSVSVSQFSHSQPPDFFGPLPQSDEFLNSGLESTSPQRRSTLLINKISPHHSRTRSSSLETALNGGGSASTIINGVHSKRNSITAKLTNGVSEFMTKLNNPPPQNQSIASSSSTGSVSFQTQPQPQPQSNVVIPTQVVTNNINKNISNSSLHSLDNENLESISSNNATTPSKRSDSRSRGTSLQIMDKFFNNISQQSQKFMMPSGTSSSVFDQQSHQQQQQQQPQQQQHQLSHSTHPSISDLSSNTLFKYHNVDFDSLTIKDLKELKGFYDQLCSQFLIVPSTPIALTNSGIDNASSTSNSIHQVNSVRNASTSSSISEEDELEEEIRGSVDHRNITANDAEAEAEAQAQAEAEAELETEGEIDIEPEAEEDTTSNGDSGSDEVASGETIASESLTSDGKLVVLQNIESVIASPAIDSV
ncbi:uncharacterized protein RJT21DRAFT_112448 [Scheffersomyces amazonensis]|uniref:uncharacterized protein n=1 Tax=Scheffersomyces amazonensis TaxID=1078765 RepID=UPI00315DDE54